MSQLVVWKYAVPFLGEFTIDVPQGAQALTVMAQYGLPVLYVLVDPDMEPCFKKTFRLVTTGQLLPDHPGRYVGSFQTLALGTSSNFVGHVFEKLT